MSFRAHPSAILTHIDNLFLDALPRDVIDDLTRSIERVSLPFRSVVTPAGEMASHIYFPVDCLLSVVATAHDGGQIEVTAVGREAFSPVGQLFVEAPSANVVVWCQVAGDAYRVPRGAMIEAMAKRPALADRVRAYLAAEHDLYAQAVLCNGLHHTTQRCARWLLQAYDRVARDEFPLTHEVLATMLGVRRAGISLAAATLQNAGAISYARARVSIVDRQTLERESCDCYGAGNGILERHGLRAPTVH